MDRATATEVFTALSSGVRLDIFRLLVQRGPEGLVAGEIATAIGIPASNLSFHLKALAHAGLVTASQEGRFQRYRPRIPLMLDVIAYLTDECCGGDPLSCSDLREVDCTPAPTANHGATT